MLDMKRTSSRSASLSWPTALRAPMPKCFQFECYLWEFITHVMVNLPGKLQMRDLISALCQLLFSSMLHSVHCPSIAFFEVPRKNTPQLRLMESCMCRTTSKNAAWPPDSLILSHYHWNRQTYRVSCAFPEKAGIFLKMALLKGDRVLRVSTPFQFQLTSTNTNKWYGAGC